MRAEPPGRALLPAGRRQQATRSSRRPRWTWTYRIRRRQGRGPDRNTLLNGSTGTNRLLSRRYAVGAKGVLFIKEDERWSPSFVTEEDSEQGPDVRYEPPQPGLIVSAWRWATRSAPRSPSRSPTSATPRYASDKGKLEVTYSYRGADQVTMPAWTYDAALIKWTYKGKIGPVRSTTPNTVSPLEGRHARQRRSSRCLRLFLVYQSRPNSGRSCSRAPQSERRPQDLMAFGVSPSRGRSHSFCGPDGLRGLWQLAEPVALGGAGHDQAGAVRAGRGPPARPSGGARPGSDGPCPAVRLAITWAPAEA